MSKETKFDGVVFQKHQGGEITRIAKKIKVGDNKRTSITIPIDTFEQIESVEHEVLEILVGNSHIKKIEFFYSRNS